MKCILIHGLGQTGKNWGEVKDALTEKEIITAAPDVFDLYDSNDYSYQALYQSFSKYLDGFMEKINLCGLSLGGLLALDYAKTHQNKINSLIIIGTPYTIPKTLFKIQNSIFKLMSKKAFNDVGLPKKQFLTLVASMLDLDISKDLEKIDCRCLIVYGDKDKVNKKYASDFNDKLPNSTIKIIKNSSHEVNKDNPSDLAKAIIEFV